MKPLEVRPLSASEISAVVALLLETNADVTLAEVERDLRHSMVLRPELQLVASADQQLVGVVAGRVDRHDASLGWSDDLVVRAAHRGQGVGDALIEAQLAAFRALGCTRVHGLSPQSLAAQVSFFARHGFRVIGEERAHQLWGVREGEPVYITECRLD